MTDAHDPFPPFTERPPIREIWRRARADYLGGDTAPVVAERYGLSERSVRRRASIESWRRCDVEADLKPPPPWSRPLPKTRSDHIAKNPAYREIAAARDADAFFLLFNPDQPDFRRVAFRRAAEGAALNKPADAAAWLRVLRLLDTCKPIEHPHVEAFSAEDHLRAALLNTLNRRGYTDPDDEPDDEPETPE